MKTQIIQLEPHDDYISVRDRMEWGQTTRVLLVWPLRGKILTRKLDLLLLKRHAESLGSQLALVTRDRDVRYHADRLGIPVFQSVRKAEQSRWLRARRKRRARPRLSRMGRTPRVRAELEELRLAAYPPPPAWLNRPATRITFFTLGVLSMLLVAALFIPGAKIHAIPEVRSDQAVIPVVASPEHQEVELSGAIPAYAQSVIIEGRATITATGQTRIPRETASGEVVFTNFTENSVSVPAGTVVSTQDEPPVRFATRAAAVIPAGGTKTVPVDAVLPGSSGSVPRHTIVAIEGTLGLSLIVDNPRKTSGGSDFIAAAPTENDYRELSALLTDSLRETALNDLKFELDSGDVILDSAPQVYQVLEEHLSPEIGEPADQLELTLRLEFRIPYAAGADLYQLGRTVLERQVPAGFVPRPETLTITQLNTPLPIGENAASWKIEVSWLLNAELDEAQAVSRVLGLTPDDAAAQIAANLPVSGAPEIVLWPEWWPRLPILPFRIQLIEKE